jgi:hypothetical protein
MKLRAILMFAALSFVSCGTIADRGVDAGRTGQPGDKSPTPSPASETWRQEVVDTTAAADYLSAIERRVIMEINMVRTNPAGYAQEYLVPIRGYYGAGLLRYPGETAIRTTEGIHALDECISQLMAAKPVGALSPKKGLTMAARDHARDQGKSGATGHTGGDRSSADVRMNRYGRWDGSAGENVDYGNGEARRIVTSLLVDDGVPSRGHRRNLMDPSFHFVGVAIGPHPVYGSMCVIDLAGAYVDKSNQG